MKLSAFAPPPSIPKPQAALDLQKGPHPSKTFNKDSSLSSSSSTKEENYCIRCLKSIWEGFKSLLSCICCCPDTSSDSLPCPLKGSHLEKAFNRNLAKIDKLVEKGASGAKFVEAIAYISIETASEKADQKKVYFSTSFHPLLDGANGPLKAKAEMQAFLKSYEAEKKPVEIVRFTATLIGDPDQDGDTLVYEQFENFLTGHKDGTALFDDQNDGLSAETSKKSRELAGWLKLHVGEKAPTLLKVEDGTWKILPT